MKNLILFFTLLLSNTTFAQTIPTIINVRKDTKLLEQLSSDYKSSLFLASDTSFEKTAKNWKHLLSAMEFYSQQINFDLRGVKLWLKVFWAKNGQIDHISYYLSNGSINIGLVDLEAFLSSFIKNYTLPQKHNHRFSYDARIIFPLYLMR
jgi:hypothetical protein